LKKERKVEMADLTVFWTTYVVLQSFWAAGAVAAYFGGMLTVGQMQKSGFKAGMPYLYHFGVWNDFVVVHLWVATVFAMFGAAWMSVLGIWMIPLIAGVALLSTLANQTWVQGPATQAHGHDGDLSLVGYLHIPQMAIIVFAIFMTALWIVKGEVPRYFAAGSVCLVLAHACMGDHWPLRLFSPTWASPWWQYNTMTPVWAAGYAVLMAAALLFFVLHFLSLAQ